MSKQEQDVPIILSLRDKTPSIPAAPCFNQKPMVICQKSKKIKKYKDIAYFVGSKNFYLLTEDACDFLDHAEKTLQERFKDQQDKTDIMSALARADLLDGVLHADIENFIKDKDDYQKRKDRLDMLQKENGTKTTTGEVKWHYYEITAIEKSIQHSLNEAKENAISQGYTIDHGELYSPRETKIQKCVEKYKKAKSLFIKNADKTPLEQIKELESTIQLLHQLKVSIFSSIIDRKMITIRLNDYEKKLSELNTQEQNLNQAIADLALVGIATPEYALANSTQGGHGTLAKYHEYLIDAENFEASLHERLEAMMVATNNEAIPSTHFFKEDHEYIKKLRLQAKQLQQQALESTSKMDPPCDLLWDINDYKPKEISRIYTDRFPLREYLRATPIPDEQNKGLNKLRYFSLNDLAIPMHIQPHNYTATRASDVSFYDAMKQYADKLTIEQNWFTDVGFFSYEEFCHSLKEKNIQIESLGEDFSKGNDWSEMMGEILYSNTIKQRIDPFDDSKQGQFFRFITQDFMHVESKSFNLLAPKITHKPGKKQTKLSVLEYSSRLSLSSCEINLIDKITGKPYLSFPSDTETKQYQQTVWNVRYLDNNEIKIIPFCFGALQNRLTIKCYGFAGIVATIGGNFTYSPSKGLEPSLPYKNESINGDDHKSTDKILKIEAKVGVEVASSIYWYPPKEDKSQGIEGIPKFLIDSYGDNVDCLEMAKAAGKAEYILLEKEILPISFRMKDKKLMVRLAIRHPSGLQFVVETLINHDVLGIWVWQFQRLLRECNYHYIGIADNEAFKTLSIMSRVMLFGQIEAGLFLARRKDTLDKIMRFFDRKHAGVVAHAICYSDNEEYLSEWICLLPPEGLGPLFEVLLCEPKSTKILIKKKEVTYDAHQTLIMQKIALARIMKYLCYYKNLTTMRRLMEEALCRTDPDNIEPYQEGRWLEFVKNTERIDNLLNRKVKLLIEYDELIRQYNIYFSNGDNNIPLNHLDRLTNPLYYNICRHEIETNNLYARTNEEKKELDRAKSTYERALLMHRMMK